ncbi:MAG: Hsp20/alpha crystallin family protein [Prevotella sp.]|nr:Hsp20/alpha crystallin family protein [Prevotella sp.]
MLFPVLRSANNWLDNSFNDFFNDGWMAKARATAPSINVKENEHEYEVEVAAPGMTKEDFNLSISDEGNLVIKMEHKNEQKDENKEEHYLRREFSYTSYQQALALPSDVEAEKIEAKVEDGVLRVVLPRKAEEQKTQRRIEVA